MATAARPLSGSAVQWHVLAADLALPEAQRTRFALRVLNTSQLGQTPKLIDAMRGSHEPPIEVVRAVLRVGLVDWRGFADQHGIEVPFVRELGQKIVRTGRTVGIEVTNPPA